MPPRPFPFSYRLGNDICSIGRIHDLINPKTVDASSPAGTPLKRFVSKLLTWPEQQYFYKRFQMVEEGLKDFQPRRNIPQLKTASQYLAGR
jgi:holo-[acyl-carrier protein] synthase